MEVILLERIEKLGQMGEVVNVKPGYARNFLLPQKKALRATTGNIEAFREQRSQLEAANLERRTEAEGIASQLDDFSVTIVRQASDSSQLYGSVTTRDISNAICEGGVTIERQQVRLTRPIKTVGLHPVNLTLHPEVSVVITVNVARSLEEAELQARGEEIGADNDRDFGLPDDDVDPDPFEDSVSTAEETLEEDSADEEPLDEEPVDVEVTEEPES